MAAKYDYQNQTSQRVKCLQSHGRRNRGGAEGAIAPPPPQYFANQKSLKVTIYKSVYSNKAKICS